jgi:hypothetical protein
MALHRYRKPLRTAAILATAAAAVAAPLAGGASAATAHRPQMTTVAQVPTGPLHLAIDRGAFYVVSASTAESGPPGTGLLTKVANGHQTVLVTVPNGEVAGVSANRGRISYTTSSQAFVGARVLLKDGRNVPIGYTLAYEKKHNPDAKVNYGFQGLSKWCIKQLPPGNAGPGPYTGIIDSHPYSILDTGSTRYIADAASNDILQQTPSGLKLVTVLPPTPMKATPALVKAAHLPKCVTGHTYLWEPVPTDIEMGPDGLLYVSALTAESVDVGVPAGKVYTVNPKTGAVREIASGLNAATGVAVAGNGTVYVAELMGNRIDKIVNGHVVPLVSVPNPADVEWDPHTSPHSVYATVNVFNPKGGELVRISRW